MSNLSKLINTLEMAPKSRKIFDYIKSAEIEFSIDISKQLDQLRGVWELRWSSSKSPFLNYIPFLDNLQILDPDKCRGLNFLRPKGFLGKSITTRNFLNWKLLIRNV